MQNATKFFRFDIKVSRTATILTTMTDQYIATPTGESERENDRK